MYRPLVQLQASAGGRKIYHGDKGRCRFCGAENSLLFRQVAHLVPEALGNRWIFSNDECDNCNQKYSLYEDSLANAVGSLLTFGGTVGKGGKVRQTGRSAGNIVLSHERVAGKRGLRIIERNAKDFRNRLTHDGEHVFLRTCLPHTPLKPLFAY